MKRASFTLVEIMVVLAIIAILAIFGIASFSAVKENSLDKEAKATLEQMNTAERIYDMENASYYPASGDPITDISSINDNLKLYLPTGASPNWNYSCYNNGCVQAARNVTGGRTWRMRISENDPVQNSTCP